MIFLNFKQLILDAEYTLVLLWGYCSPILMGINIVFGILFLKGVQILKFGRHIKFLADLTQSLYKKED